MNLRELKCFVLIMAAVFAAVSCKDDDDDMTTYPSLYGLTFDCPLFVAPGQVVTLVPEGVIHPEGESVGYYWKVTPTMVLSDTTRLDNGLDSDGGETDGSFVHRFSDTLKTYVVSCGAFASGYAGDTYQVKVSVVKGGLDQSLTGTEIVENDPHVTVDGIDYYYKEIGGLEWFRNNLADAASGAPYFGEDVTSDVFGRYYSYEEACNACPDGWRLPTEADWLSLCAESGATDLQPYSTIGGMASKLFADVSFNGEQMLEYWPAVGQITNESGISLIPSGFSNLGIRNDGGKYPYAVFEGMNTYAAVWTADPVPGEEGMAYYRYLIADQPDFYVGKGDVSSFGASVRCVREVE